MVGAGRERKKATEKGTHHETCDLGRGETGGDEASLTRLGVGDTCVHPKKT